MVERKFETGFPITQCVLEGIQQGQIFDLGNTTFVLHKAGFGSLINPENCDWEMLVDFFRSPAVPSYFHIYDAPEELIHLVKHYSLKFNQRVRTRWVLSYKENKPLSYTIPEEYFISPVKERQFEILRTLPLDLENKFWNGKKDFLEHAMGYVLWSKASNQPASICYSASTVAKKAEIDIWTAESYRNRGLGKVVTSCFIEQCIKSNTIPNWDCFEDNISSLSVAKSLLFSLEFKYKFLSIFKK